MKHLATDPASPHQLPPADAPRASLMAAMLRATARAEDRHFWFRGLRRNARVFLAPALRRPPALIVDAGAGTGRNLEWLSALGPAVGVELNETGLAAGRAFGRRLTQATVTRLPFPDAVADLVTSFDVLYCLDDEDERQAVAEMYRVLKPGGHLLVNVAALDVLRGAHSTLTSERRRYTPARLSRLLTAAGFTVTRMSFASLPPFPAVLISRTFERATRRTAPSDANLRVPAAPVNAVLSAAVAVEGWLLRVIDLPLGTSLMCLATKPSDATR